MRFSQHLQLYKAKKNFMWEHVESVHNGEAGADHSTDFYMVLHCVDGHPIRRVVRESVRIKGAREEEEKGGAILWNDKNEYFGVKTVRPEFKQD